MDGWMDGWMDAAALVCGLWVWAWPRATARPSILRHEGRGGPCRQPISPSQFQPEQPGASELGTIW